MANQVSVTAVSCTALAVAARTASSTRAPTWRKRASTWALAATCSLRCRCSLVAARAAAAASAVSWLALRRTAAHTRSARAGGGRAGARGEAAAARLQRPLGVRLRAGEATRMPHGHSARHSARRACRVYTCTCTCAVCMLRVRCARCARSACVPHRASARRRASRSELAISSARSRLVSDSRAAARSALSSASSARRLRRSCCSCCSAACPWPAPSPETSSPSRLTSPSPPGVPPLTPPPPPPPLPAASLPPPTRASAISFHRLQAGRSSAATWLPARSPHCASRTQPGWLPHALLTATAAVSHAVLPAGGAWLASDGREESGATPLAASELLLPLLCAAAAAAPSLPSPGCGGAREHHHDLSAAVTLATSALSPAAAFTPAQPPAVDILKHARPALLAWSHACPATALAAAAALEHACLPSVPSSPHASLMSATALLPPRELPAADGAESTILSLRHHSAAVACRDG